MPESRGKYSLDDLFRAKRNEKPEPQFWAQFDRELKSKQRLLIQNQLARETRVKTPLTTRIYKYCAIGTSFGVAAFAVYFGLQPNSQTPTSATIAQQSENLDPPRFTVAPNPESAPQISQPIGLKEFSTIAQTSNPRIVVKSPATQVAKVVATPTQITALETLAELESTIRANRSSGPTPSANDSFASASGLFDSELTEIASFEEDTLADDWGIENTYLLGKYADPLTGTMSNARPPAAISEIQSVSFSQLDDALSSKSRRSDRSIDALTVRF